MKSVWCRATCGVSRAFSAGRSAILVILLAGCERDADRGRSSGPDPVRSGPKGADSVHEVTGRLTPATAPTAAVGSARDPQPALDPSPAAVPPRDAGALADPASGAPSPTCINGWSTPERGTPLRKAALDMMRVARGERFMIDEMRYFVGPEDADVMRPQRQIERWYVKGYTLGKPQRRLRWLVRRAEVGSGVDAVAPYDSKGYGPGTWRRIGATDPNLADPFLYPCDRVPRGQNCMGLPPELLGCLEGT